MMMPAGLKAIISEQWNCVERQHIEGLRGSRVLQQLRLHDAALVRVRQNVAVQQRIARPCTSPVHSHHRPALNIIQYRRTDNNLICTKAAWLLCRNKENKVQNYEMLR